MIVQFTAEKDTRMELIQQVFTESKKANALKFNIEILELTLPSKYEHRFPIHPINGIVKVQIRSDGKVLFNGKKINLNQIMQQAKNEIITFQAIKGVNKQPIFVVTADEKAEYQFFLDVIDQLKEAKCTKISVTEQ